MSADPIRGKTVRWSYSDGPVKGRTFEHAFGTDGMVTWREVDRTLQAARVASKEPGVRYEVARINDDVYAVSYLAASGFTLTTIVDESTGAIASFASNEKQLVAQRGKLEP